MTDFVIVVATAAMLAAPAPAPGASAPSPGAALAATSPAPLHAPTVGFRVYPDAASCEQATAALTAPPNARLVCVPVEPMVGEMTSAY
jgi:hypothetical protein